MNTQQFLSSLEEMYASNLEISRRKNADYAGEGDPFKNFKLCESLGITTVEKGILVRISDKLSRISNLLDKEAKVSDESIMDTLKDMANYSMILAVYLKQNETK